MKKSRLLFIIAAAVIVTVCVLVVLMQVCGIGISKGVYLETKNGGMIIIDNSPIKMTDRTGLRLLEKLETGDVITIFHTAIAESYPGKTGVHAVFRSSEKETISENVIEVLTDLGWLEK